MARIVGRARQREGVGLGMRISETLVMIGLGLAILLGIRYYFVVYRNSPGYALGGYLGAIKSGKVEQQYALIDDADKKEFFPRLTDYDKNAPQARGYTTRISDVIMEPEKLDPKNPNVATITAMVSIRPRSGGQQLYQTGETKEYKNRFTMRKDDKGDWKVWLKRSVPEMEMLTAEPNPKGDPLNP